jgi:hypothetical protein
MQQQLYNDGMSKSLTDEHYELTSQCQEKKEHQDDHTMVVELQEEDSEVEHQEVEIEVDMVHQDEMITDHGSHQFVRYCKIYLQI